MKKKGIKEEIVTTFILSQSAAHTIPLASLFNRGLKHKGIFPTKSPQFSKCLPFPVPISSLS